ncbi:MAG: gluconokinase [Jaaginema sp. PMC 1079.18]|nr:gluconokinase [Jaaginema sp. PMC 1080.18]MEC4849916.1 gluconokinase [Jaaginema sp. PMC 1079.18]MEC4868852.1 gluconokinase [Jaaginema sp. PMC 1078.18]
MTIILMGVSGSGKTTIGRLLAPRINGIFQDADWFHPTTNIQKMSRGEALTDEDRNLWLDVLSNAIEHWNQEEKPYILACSALKHQYRDRLQFNNDGASFVYLKGSKSLIRDRLQNRQNHFMSSALLDSQFAALEEPHNAIEVNIDATPDAIATEICQKLSLSG